ncbi:LOW QUALITY PROTEIN: autophagy-related protein 2-like [Primulina tabacum]|uniref:LOW QUALITY PROTEIN: autophagy-related protein 2-like n=1 Tax=Primulina tabacum TaxID=48773 RepID=UPI003F5A23D8
MFTWNIAKSAEAMFSRWAVKRLCKFLLKKKLGQFILGDIDLNQLDVQLRAGTIQLTDLALNVDYINHKFGTAPVFVKEGSIGSLKVTMPWKNGGCRIEVGELEVVLAPRRAKISEDKHESCRDTKNDHTSFSNASNMLENEVLNNELTNVAIDVHEGVKTIAKMVKWLLSSFHLQIKKLIVAFDPLLEEENKKRLDRTLVLRIGELECGTHISEDSSSGSSTKVHNFLGFSQLTNFVKFQGAVLELLHMDGLDHQSPPEVLTETHLVDWFSGHCSSDSMTTIVSGEKGGFSGNLKLSIPWKNGSLDICKVDADLNIEPLELRLQPSTIRCFIFLWGLFKDIGEECEDRNHCGLPNNSSAPSYCITPDKGISSNEGFAGNFCLMEKEPENALLSESHLISDWVSKSQKPRNDEEPDFGASVDQFFECFDGLRNSQSALGNSGMWNWTCSVFSAITAASNLASGSLHVALEQQHVETNFNASISKLSLLFSFADEDQKEPSKIKNDEGNGAFHIRCVCAQLVDLLIVFQVCPREMKFESTVHRIQLIDHLYSKNESVSLEARGCNENSKSEISLIQQTQDGVQSALRTFENSSKDQGLDHCSGCFVDISLSIQDSNSCSHISNRNNVHGKDASVKLLQTSGISQCHVTVNSGSSGGLLQGPTSFSLKLAPYVFWVNFDLINMMLDFLNEMANCVEQTAMESGFVLKSESKKYGPSPLGDQGKISLQHGSIMTKKSVEGNIFFPNARIILCFPLSGHKDFSSYLCSEQFIAFDIVSSNIGGKENKFARPKPVASPNKRDVIAASCSLYLYLGNLHLFYITSSFMDKSVGSGTYRQEPRFAVEKIASGMKGTGHLPLICMFWQEGAVTGPWIAKKARLLACPAENARSKDNTDGKGFEFASVTTVKDITDFDTHCRQEIRSSSAFFFHAQLPPITIDLGKHQYENICGLLTQVIEHFSCIVSDPVHTGEEDSTSQTSFLVECSSVTVSVNIEPACDVKYSELKELPGFWHSLTLQVDKFELLSVSNIGGIRCASFLWVSHGQGSLWGSITKGLQREFVLISCNDSTTGRGNGEGSNVLSSKFSGSEIINLWDPESIHNFTSVNVRSATFIAIGGRLDWFNSIVCFFSLPFSEPDQAGDKSLDKICGSSFVLNLVDVGLNYEPYLKKLTTSESSDFISSEMNANEAMDELYVSCLLAASSLKLSSASVDDCTAGEHKIRLQDLGLLLCTVSESKLVSGTYSAENLRKAGYVKVSQEAHVELLLRTNCENGHAWELECDESHIVLSTCHDTTLGLVRLGAQLQKLFAPDVQEHVVHLENRWINAQQIHENRDERTLGNESPPSVSHTQISSVDNRPRTGNLMDEIREDVFQLDGNSDGQAKFFEPHLRSLSTDISFVGASMATSLDEKIPELIEEYFLSDLCPLSELALKSHSSDMFYCKSGAVGVAQTGNCGWYKDTSLRILENHASKVNEQSNVQQLFENEASSSDSKNGHVGKAEGCIIFKNVNIFWRMYGGSDWYNIRNISRPSAVITSGRDATICFELALSGIGFEYNFYPDGEISASRLSLTVNDFCLNDKSDHAPWKLVLGYYRSKKHPRKFSTKAVKLNLDAVKPDPSIPLEENRLRIALLPMRLHLHQSQLDFLINFFGNNNSSSEPSPGTPSVSDQSGEQAEKSRNLLCSAISVEAFLPYFQKFDIWPLLIRVDYSPCHVDLTALSGGKYVELVNLVPWKDVELQLKHVQGVGLYGWNSVCETILGEWLEDISKNQIHKLLKGLPPIKSLVAVGSGAAKLVSLPVMNYRKDHRLIKGMQRGTIAFLRSISLEAIGLGVHLAAGAHNILLQAEHILTSIPPSVPWQVESRVATIVRSNQPKDAQQGIHQACQSITDGLGKTASALVQTPLKKLQRGAGVGSALATAVQATPAAAIAPASAAAHAVHCALLGFRNSLDPERKRESLEKYSGRAPPRESIQ